MPIKVNAFSAQRDYRLQTIIMLVLQHF